MMDSSFARHAAELLPFCRERGYNDRVALLWNLSRHSGRRRLAVWNFRKGCAEYVFVVSHGSGSAESHVRSACARVSNEDGSHLSSEGRALVAERYTGSYGVAYRLDGLDETNASLRPRCVVLHGWRYMSRRVDARHGDAGFYPSTRAEGSVMGLYGLIVARRCSESDYFSYFYLSTND